MTEKEKLLEQCKEAYLAAVMEETGEQESECNRNNGELVSKPVKRRNRTVCNVVRTVLSVLLVLAAIVTILFQIFPDLRIRVFNTFLNLYESQSVISFEKIAPELVITVGWIPEGFEKTEDGFHEMSSWNGFNNHEGAIIHIQKSFSPTITLGAETPETKVIKMHGYDATLMTENEEVYLLWMNEKEQVMYFIYTEKVPVETTLKFAENIS